MLKIYYGELEDAIDNTAVYFKNVYKDRWIIDDLTKQMIKDVDKSEVKSSNLIYSKVLGEISPLQLSTGVKTLILMNFEPKTIFNASRCGDNCAKWILKIAENKNITINLKHIMRFGNKKFNTKVLVLNNNKEVKNMDELIDACIDYV